MKKDKRYNNYFDNYTNKYKDTFKLGLFYVAVSLIGYLIYNIFWKLLMDNEIKAIQYET